MICFGDCGKSDNLECLRKLKLFLYWPGYYLCRIVRHFFELQEKLQSKTMIKGNKQQPFLPVIILFIVFNGIFVSGKNILAKLDTDQSVLIIGNLILFVATFLSYLLSLRGFKSDNPHASVRSVYGSFMIKFFICIIAAFAYIMSAKKNVNKPALFTCMGLYIIYTFVEVSILTKLSKQKKNA
jgi:Ca2+/Na+ antiporter